MEYKIQHIGDQNICVVDTDVDLQEEGALSSSEYYRRIKDVKGIVTCNIQDRYQIFLKKGTLFNWNDIVPKVVVILRDTFAPGEEIQEVT